MGDSLEGRILGQSESTALEGMSASTLRLEPIDTNQLSALATRNLYFDLANYFHNNLSPGVFFRSWFDGYSVHEVLLAWQFCYSVNFIRQYHPEKYREIDGEIRGAFNRPPIVLTESARAKLGQGMVLPSSTYRPDIRNESQVDASYRPALDGYIRLRNNMLNSGFRPSRLKELSLDELLKEADQVDMWLQYLSYGEDGHLYIIMGAELFIAQHLARVVGRAGFLGAAAHGTAVFVLSIAEQAYEKEMIRRVELSDSDIITEGYLTDRVDELGLLFLDLSFS